MAKNEIHSEQGAAPRVFKASEVHKRRPGKTPSVKPEAKPAAEPETQAELRPPVQEEPVLQAEPELEPKPAPEPEPKPKPKLKQPSNPEPVPVEEPEPEPEEEPKPARKRRLGLRIALGVLGVFVAALLVCVGFLSADRWMLRDDHTMMLGEWYVQGSDASVVFSDSQITFNLETHYDYTIDDKAKTISYSFGDLQGQGHYWFTADRKHLVVIDGKDYTVVGTALEDWSRQIGDFFQDLFGGGAKLPEGEGVVVFTRTKS